MKKLLQLIFSLWLFQAQAAPRTWTDTQGRSLQAEYITSDATTVTLSISGKHHQIPISRFSPADQTYIREQNGNSPATAAPSSAPATLPPMTQRQIAEFFYKERADSRPQINVMVGEQFSRTSSTQQLPVGDFHVHSIFEITASAKPFPWPLLQQMPKLIDLGIEGTGPISAAEIAHLSALDSPFSLRLDGAATLDSAAIAAFPRLPTLKVLFIAANLASPQDLPTLATRCPNLETLIIKHPGTATQPPQITPTELIPLLARWKKLERITLNRIPFTAKTAAAISTCDALEDLTLEGCGPLTAPAFTPLASLKKLKKLRIRFDTDLTPDDLQTIQQTLKTCLIEHTK